MFLAAAQVCWKSFKTCFLSLIKKKNIFTLNLLLETALSVWVAVSWSWSFMWGNQLFNISSILRMISTYFSLRTKERTTEYLLVRSCVNRNVSKHFTEMSSLHQMQPEKYLSWTASEHSGSKGCAPCVCAWGGNGAEHISHMFGARTWLDVEQLRSCLNINPKATAASNSVTVERNYTQECSDETRWWRVGISLRHMTGTFPLYFIEHVKFMREIIC